MAQLADLPNEIISIIASHLDSYSRIHLSKSCQRFNNFFIDNSVTKFTSFGMHYGNDVNYHDFKNYMKNNRKHITYLDLSYSHWFKELLLSIIINLPNLKYLNVVGTYLDLKNVTFILERNKSIDSVSTTFTLDNYSNIKNLKYIHYVVESRERFYLYLLAKTTVEELKLTAPRIDTYYLKTLCHIKEITIKLTNPSKFSLLNSKTLAEKFYMAIETLTGIFISPEIVNEFISMNNLITCHSIDDLENETLISLYFCSKNNDKKLDKFKERIKGYIANRSSSNIALYSSKYCPKAHFDIVQYLINLENVRRLSLQPCVLATKVQSMSQSNELFKPKRVSRIQTNVKEMSILEKISSTNKNIEMLQIKEKLHCNCEHIMNEWMLKSTYLESIPILKKLKYLTLHNVPFLTIKALKIIFEKCSLLEQISITTTMKDVGTTQNISRILNLCKNIRIFHLDGFVSDINTFVESFESNTLTLVCVIYHDEDYKYTGNELKSTLMQIPSRCPRLKYLTVYNDSNLPKQQIKMLSKIQTHVNKNINGLVLNLKSPKYLFMNGINDIGEFV